MTSHAIVIGGGPAGLMAAEQLLRAGIAVDLYEAMPSLGRKFLMAGKGGLNITHSEPMERLVGRYGARASLVGDWLAAFGPSELRQWIHELGVETFVGTSGRVFPAEMKAAPLLRAWLHRLRSEGLRIHVRHRWTGWSAEGGLQFATPRGIVEASAAATILALGGGSWPQLGSDGAWQSLLMQQGIDIAPLVPANCGFDIGWSDHFRARHAGAALKNLAATLDGGRRTGEAIITESGIEGGLIYALSARLRDRIAEKGEAILNLDLLPDRPVDDIAHILAARGSRSLSSHLKSALHLPPAKAALLRECLPADRLNDARAIADALKNLPLTLRAPRPLAEAISSAGGIRLEALTADLMCSAKPGLFCCGEMLDWEAPTGGYLLSACFASGLVAGRGAAAWIKRPPAPSGR